MKYTLSIVHAENNHFPNERHLARLDFALLSRGWRAESITTNGYRTIVTVGTAKVVTGGEVVADLQAAVEESGGPKGIPDIYYGTPVVIGNP
jgi:hypothetical protein